MTTDLLSSPCAIGETATTGVTLPLGARVTAVRFETSFKTVEQKHEDRDDGTWYELSATNVGDEDARLVAWIDYAEAKTDDRDASFATMDGR